MDDFSKYLIVIEYNPVHLMEQIISDDDAKYLQIYNSLFINRAVRNSCS